MLKALAAARARTPGRVVAYEDLLEVGWPGERILRDAAMNRVYVAIANLRRAGLGDYLQREEGGYRIDPSVRVHLVEPV